MWPRSVSVVISSLAGGNRYRGYLEIKFSPPGENRIPLLLAAGTPIERRARLWLTRYVRVALKRRNNRANRSLALEETSKSLVVEVGWENYYARRTRC